MARFDLSDVEWRLIEPLLPNKPRGVARVDDRRVLNGIFMCCEPARRGETCRSATGPIRQSTIALTDGLGPVCGFGSSRACRPARQAPWR